MRYRITVNVNSYDDELKVKKILSVALPNATDIFLELPFRDTDFNYRMTVIGFNVNCVVVDVISLADKPIGEEML